MFKDNSADTNLGNLKNLFIGTKFYFISAKRLEESSVSSFFWKVKVFNELSKLLKYFNAVTMGDNIHYIYQLYILRKESKI